MPEAALVPAGRIEAAILALRGSRVMLDADLAALYGVPVKSLNQAVKRNRDRFPSDFMFQLTPSEFRRLRSQIVTAKTGRGGRRTAPYVFTEQGVAMLSSVLRGERAVRVNIDIMRTFVRLRHMLRANVDLERRLTSLERRYDRRFKVVFEAMRQLMTPPEQARRPIGFRTGTRH